jgi:glycosyltransferase involved in cell wall biosynthesis
LVSRLPVKVSVCLPVFNGERFLASAIEGVLNQTFQDFELIISDDGSTDASWDVIDRFARSDRRIKASRTAGRLGVFENYNECIRRTAGIYIKFFAQDDLLQKEHLERCVSVLDEHSTVALVATRRNWIDEHNRDISNVSSTPSTTDFLCGDTPIPGLNVVRNSLVPVVNFIGEPVAVTIARRCLGSGFDTSYRHLGDLDYWLRVLLEGDYYFVDETLCNFRIHEQSETRRNNRGLFFAPDVLRLGRKFERELVRSGCSQETFNRQCVRDMAVHLQHLSGTEQLSVGDLRSLAESANVPSTESSLLADFLDFRELAFHALLQMQALSVQGHPVAPSQPPPRNKHYTEQHAKEVVGNLERTLRSLLGSSSWRSTRFLREIKRSTILLRTVDDALLKPRENLTDKETYVKYLRHTIAQVTKSLSWKLSCPLRALGMADKALPFNDANLAALEHHPLFDVPYYLRQIPHLSGSDHLDPIVHFLLYGGRQGLNPHPLFDSDFYLRQYPDVADGGVIPLLHYLEDGIWEARDPHILFNTAYYLEQNPDIGKCSFNPLVHYLQYGARQKLSPHPLFDVEYYLQQDPDLKDYADNPLIHYLQFGAEAGFNPHPLFDGSFYRQYLAGTAGEDMNPLVHYLTSGAPQGYDPCPGFSGRAYLVRYPDVADCGTNPLVHYSRFGRLEPRVGRRFASIAHGVRALSRPEFIAALKRIRAATTDRLSHIVTLGSLTRGGSERSACSFVKALAQRIGLDSILVLITDGSEVTCADWLPSGTRVVNLLAIEPSLSLEERAIIFLDVLKHTRSEQCIGIISQTFWNALDCHVEICRRELSSKFTGYLGGYDCFVKDNAWGFNNGPISRLIEFIDLIVTDNGTLAETMITQYRHVPEIGSKVVTCYNAIAEDLRSRLSNTYSRAQSTERKKVLWASRIDPTKQPEVLSRIAQNMPDVEFEVFGVVSPEYDASFLQIIPNIKLMGEYKDFSFIPKQDKALFLHTSRTDGIPNVLLEAACAGLPIVAPDAGGIAEMITPETGWLISQCDDIDGYVKAIRQALGDPEEANRRALNAQELVDERHHWTAFCQRASTLLVTANQPSVTVAPLVSHQLKARAVR